MADRTRKTFKRELAAVMLALLFGFFLWGVFRETAMQAAEFLTVPVFGFAGGAFGLDAWAKQVQPQSGTQR